MDDFGKDSIQLHCFQFFGNELIITQFSNLFIRILFWEIDLFSKI